MAPSGASLKIQSENNEISSPGRPSHAAPAELAVVSVALYDLSLTNKKAVLDLPKIGAVRQFQFHECTDLTA
jgi:hypothetical protein